MGQGIIKLKQKPSQFLDYKAYLQAIYQAEKEARPHYSYVQFSEDLGLGPSNVAWLIIKGQRKLTRNTSQKIIEAIQLKGYEKQYFETMIRYAHETKAQALDELLQKMVSLKSRCINNSTDEQTLKFYSQWQHAIIFEMVGFKEFSSDPKWIRSHLNFHLSEREIKESLAMLEDLQLITYAAEQKRHIKLVQDFSTSSEVLGLGVVQYHKKMIDLGKSSIENLPAEYRDIGAVTVAVTPEGVRRIKEEVQAFRNHLMMIASEYADPSEIVQVNIQVFSLTHTTTKKEEDPDS